MISFLRFVVHGSEFNVSFLVEVYYIVLLIMLTKLAFGQCMQNGTRTATLAMTRMWPQSWLNLASWLF